jgi:hypothetical protein
MVVRSWIENLIVIPGLVLACDYVLGFICKWLLCLCTDYGV